MSLRFAGRTASRSSTTCSRCAPYVALAPPPSARATLLPRSRPEPDLLFPALSPSSTHTPRASASRRSRPSSRPCRRPCPSSAAPTGSSARCGTCSAVRALPSVLPCPVPRLPSASRYLDGLASSGWCRSWMLTDPLSALATRSLLRGPPGPAPDPDRLRRVLDFAHLQSAGGLANVARLGVLQDLRATRCARTSP